MIGIDTNVLVRYITQDDRLQSKTAAKLLETECTSQNPGFINDIVLCELVWVLDDAYEYSQKQIADVLKQIIRTAQLRVAQPALVWRAIEQYESGFDFADAMISELNLHSDCRDTVTFDRRASRLPGFRLLDER